MKTRPSQFLLIFILILGLTTVYSCGGGGGGSSGGGGGITLASVEPFYPVNGADWNDYIKNDSVTIYEASDTAATGTETGGYDQLLHGGEMRAFAVSGKSSCTGLVVADSAGAFNWFCDNTNPVTMISTGLADGKYLSDLIDFTSGAWKQLSVTVTDGGATYGTTPASTWWNNPIIADNDGGALAISGNVYIVTTSTPGAGYTIQSDNIAMVIQPGIIMQGPKLGISTAVVATSAGRKFLWLEGSIDASGDDVGVFWSPVFSVLRDVQIDGADTGISLLGLYMEISNNGKIYDVTSSNNAGYGIWVTSSHNNDFEKIVSMNNISDGIRLWNSNLNNLYDVKTSENRTGMYLNGSNDNELRSVATHNNRNSGLVLGESLRNKVYNVTSVNNIGSGVQLVSSSRNNTLSHITANNNDSGFIVNSSADNAVSDVTAFNNNSLGFSLAWSDNNFVSNISVINNGSSGARLFSATNNTMVNIASVNNYLNGFEASQSPNNVLFNIAALNNRLSGVNLLNNSNFNTFAGILKVGGNGGQDCSESGGVSQGVVNINCTNTGAYGSTTYTGHTSSAVLHRASLHALDSFMGKVTINDGTNSSDSNGTALYDSITDWTSFDNDYRGWGRDGNAFADTSHVFAVMSGMTARIWDWNLAATGDTADNGSAVLHSALVFPETKWGWLPFTWSLSGTTNYLVHAVEVMDDGIGNENVLCESNETCLVTHNIGSYQGHGPMISAGSHSVGTTIINVTLMDYTTNGY